MEKLQECKAVVDNISKLDDIPIVQSTELKQMFDEGGKQIKDYLNSILLPKINDEIITNIDSNTSSIEKMKTDVESITNKVDTTSAKIYVNSTTTSPQDTSPEIRFVKSTAPTTSNYGANLPVGSIVFVY